MGRDQRPRLDRFAEFLQHIGAFADLADHEFNVESPSQAAGTARSGNSLPGIPVGGTPFFEKISELSGQASHPIIGPPAVASRFNAMNNSHEYTSKAHYRLSAIAGFGNATSGASGIVLFFWMVQSLPSHNAVVSTDIWANTGSAPAPKQPGIRQVFHSYIS